MPLNVQDLSGTASTTVLTSSGTSGAYSLSATVTANGPYSPSGSVTFDDTTASNQLKSSTLSFSPTALTLASASQPADGDSGACAVVTGDFNNDGLADVAVANGCSYPGAIPANVLVILISKGDGTFQTAASVAGLANTQVNTLVTGDFNNDGNLDLLIDLNGQPALLAGRGDGTFSAASSISTACSTTDTYYNGQGLTTQSANWITDFAVGDFNRDGKLDFAVVCASQQATGQNTYNYSPFVAYLELGNGAGSFTSGGSTPAISTMPQFVAAGDLNNDGKTDLVMSGFSYNYTTNSASGGLSVLLGEGDGTFGNPDRH